MLELNVFKPLFFLLALFFGFGSPAIAGKACGQFLSPLDRQPEKNCRCGKDLTMLNIKSPFKDLELVAICDPDGNLPTRENNHIVYGNYFFNGKQVFSGTIKIQEDIAGNSGSDIIVNFFGEPIKPLSPFFHSYILLSFEDFDTERARVSFRAPKTSVEKNCWKAKVIFSAKEVVASYFRSGDIGHNYVRGWTVLKAGNYSPCGSDS